MDESIHLIVRWETIIKKFVLVDTLILNNKLLMKIQQKIELLLVLNLHILL